MPCLHGNVNALATLTSACRRVSFHLSLQEVEREDSRLDRSLPAAASATDLRAAIMLSTWGARLILFEAFVHGTTKFCRDIDPVCRGVEAAGSSFWLNWLASSFAAACSVHAIITQIAASMPSCPCGSASPFCNLAQPCHGFPNPAIRPSSKTKLLTVGGPLASRMPWLRSIMSSTTVSS